MSSITWHPLCEEKDLKKIRRKDLGKYITKHPVIYRNNGGDLIKHDQTDYFYNDSWSTTGTWLIHKKYTTKLYNMFYL